MKLAVLLLCLTSTVVCAQSSPAEFPDGAMPVSAAALQGAVSGKVFSVKPASGPAWRWQLNSDGYFFINIGSFSDSGKWSVKESALCSEGTKGKYSCNEVRAVGTDHYLKRDSGEVVKLVVQ